MDITKALQLVPEGQKIVQQHSFFSDYKQQLFNKSIQDVKFETVMEAILKYEDDDLFSKDTIDEESLKKNYLEFKILNEKLILDAFNSTPIDTIPIIEGV